MKLTFADPDLETLAFDPSCTLRYPAAIVSGYRKRIQGIQAAKDERDLRAMKSWRWEKLQGNRSHQYSIRINDQYRIIFELYRDDENDKAIRIVSIEDYH
jgi:proteic killer suppression protein